METKICSKCGRELPLTCFNGSKDTQDGFQRWCKECHSEYNKTHKRRRGKSQSPLSRFSEEELKAELKARTGSLVINPTPREMMEALAKLGYRGKLEYTQIHVIDINNF